MDMTKMGPLAADHPLVNFQECAACGQLFQASEYVSLVKVGPGDSKEERRKAREGRAYTAVAVPVHWECATGEED